MSENNATQTENTTDTATKDTTATDTTAQDTQTTQTTETGTGNGYNLGRDVDNDGTNDVNHYQDATGANFTTHYDQQGNTVMEEADLDGDGYFETTARPVDGDTVQYQTDVTGNGQMDVSQYTDMFGHTYQQDMLDNDQVAETRLDLDKDGITETQLTDTNGDGQFDTIVLDTDGDGIANAELVDLDGDGKFEKISVDADNSDGILETEVTAAEFDMQDFGNVADYEALIPHQTETDIDTSSMEDDMGADDLSGAEM